MIDLEEIPGRRPAEELRRLARYQRWVMGVMLAEIALWVGCLLFGMARGRDLAAFSQIPLVATVALGCTGGIFAFLAYCTTRNAVTALLMGVACVPPLLGFFALAVANGVATRELQASGVAVGVFGADVDAIEDVPGLYDEQDGW